MPHPAPAAALCLLTAALVATALAQPTTPPPEQQQPPQPAQAAPATSTTTAPQRIEITSERANETQQRRESTAAKIVIGREEIERFGDTSTQDLLKRLPGVSAQGAPGRGRGIRMRGLGGNYVQILIDGERVPPGFSIDSISPEQIERIEILRAPTAETGARAIAGTINFVMREGFRRKRNELRLNTGVENGRASGGLNWTRNDSAGPFIYNGSLTAFRRHRGDESETVTTTQDLVAGTPATVRRESNFSVEERQGVHATGRLQWRGEDGTSALLNPLFIHSEGDTTRRGEIDDAGTPGSFAGRTDSRFSLLRLNAQWNQRLGPTRAEFKLGGSQSRWRADTERQEFDATGAPTTRTDDDTDVVNRNASASAKFSTLLDNEHSLVTGVEAEAERRTEERSTLQNGVPVLAEFGSNLQASSRRLALYAQDEWTVSPHWAAHVGARWEGIDTRGDGEAGETVRNQSRVFTPLLHAVWKPDPKGQDQVRFSLTRSYRSPSLSNLVARPNLNSQEPAPGPNSPTRADRAGNAALKPELATGLDVAFERYLKNGGLLSANVFHRRISDLIRTQTTLETVSWASVPRWVARPQNIGDASVSGVELEAKVRASDVWAGAAPVDLRANLSLFHSRVQSVPGPNNTLDQQPGATANVGADYRLRGLPVTIGGNLNYTPGYDSRLSETQFAFRGRKLVADAYALWVVNPTVQVRLAASNAGAQDLHTSSTLDDGLVREVAQTRERTFVDWQLRLEVKL